MSHHSPRALLRTLSRIVLVCEPLIAPTCASQLDWSVLERADDVEASETRRAVGGQSKESRPGIDRPLFSSWLAVHRAAMANGGYRAGQMVVISIDQPPEINARWARDCNLNGWTFCVHPSPQPNQGLFRGVHRAVGLADGTLALEHTAPRLNAQIESARRWHRDLPSASVCGPPLPPATDALGPWQVQTDMAWVVPPLVVGTWTTRPIAADPSSRPIVGCAGGVCR